MKGISIFYLVLAQILRFALRLAAGYLAFFEVKTEQQNELVEALVGYVVPILLLLVAEAWSFAQKKYFPVLFEQARRAQADTNPEVIKLLASGKTSAPVIY